MTMQWARFAIVAFALSLAGCSDIVREAQKAEREGRYIDNSMMSQMYKHSYKPGNPEYLERDFEAGANFICDEIAQKRGHDFCADADINWR